MSEENVELAHRGVEVFNRRDFDAFVALCDPEIRWEHWLADLEGDLTGVDAVRAWHEDLARHFDPWRIDCDDFRDLGDRVLALGTLRAVGKESGVETEMPWTVVATFRNGLLTHFIDYGDRDRALEAAGLSE
jgi:ketosteroid isomerase-like protein